MRADHPGQAGFTFAPPPKPKAPRDEQAEHLSRVTGRIADTVLEFVRAHVGEWFHLSDLTAFVMQRRGGAPASPDRILRLLRAEGRVRYDVDRAASKYLVREVRP